MVIGSLALESLVNSTVKVTSPPGSGTLVGLAVLTVVMAGCTSSIVTVASSESLTGLPSSSVPEPVTVSVSVSPALPATKAVKLQV